MMTATVSPSIDAVAAIDVGVETMCGELRAADGTVLRSLDAPTVTGHGDAALVEALRVFAAKLVSQRRCRVVAAGVVVPGIVDSAAGIARHSAEFGWHNVALGELLSTDLGLPVRIDHNVRAAALAEGRDGVAAGVEDWLYLSVSTTVVAAAVVAGRLQRGATGAAGELGHLPIYPFGECCSCGQRGCVEAYASTSAVANRYARISGQHSSAAALASRIGRDPLADDVWGQAAAALGVALTTYTMLNDPDVIVLSGEIRDFDEAVVGLIRQELRSRLAWRQAPRVASARLSGTQAALTGAAILGWELLS